MLTKFSIFIVGIITITIPLLSSSSVFFIVILTVITEICTWKYQSIRSVWEKIHRELDERDSFGKDLAPSRIESADLIIRLAEVLLMLDAYSEMYSPVLL